MRACCLLAWFSNIPPTLVAGCSWLPQYLVSSHRCKEHQSLAQSCAEGEGQMGLLQLLVLEPALGNMVSGFAVQSQVPDLCLQSTSVEVVCNCAHRSIPISSRLLIFVGFSFADHKHVFRAHIVSPLTSWTLTGQFFGYCVIVVFFS